MNYKNQIQSVFVLLLLFFSMATYSQEIKNKALNKAYLGGETAFFNYVNAKIKYPKKAKTKGLMGLSVFSFRINCQNTPEDFIFTTKLGNKIEEELEKVMLKTKGNWAECAKGKTRERIHLKIAFSLNFLYSPKDVDALVDAVGEFKVEKDEVLNQKMELALKEKDFKKAKNALDLLLKRYPFNENYKNKLSELESN